MRNAELAREADADGVFLINHGMSSRELLDIHTVVTEMFPEWWVGVNCLDLAPAAVFSFITSRVHGVWTDNAMIREDQREQSAAAAVLEARQRSGWSGLYFGGVAFKERSAGGLSIGDCQRNQT